MVKQTFDAISRPDATAIAVTVDAAARSLGGCRSS
jgi:hypothetical protein